MTNGTSSAEASPAVPSMICLSNDEQREDELHGVPDLEGAHGMLEERSSADELHLRHFADSGVDELLHELLQRAWILRLAGGGPHEPIACEIVDERLDDDDGRVLRPPHHADVAPSVPVVPPERLVITGAPDDRGVLAFSLAADRSQCDHSFDLSALKPAFGARGALQLRRRHEAIGGLAVHTAGGEFPDERFLSGHLQRLAVGDDERRHGLAGEIQPRHVRRPPHIHELRGRRHRGGGARDKGSDPRCAHVGNLPAPGAARSLLGALIGRGEAWDSPQFWTIGLPAVLVSAALGFLARRREWLWTFAIVPAQVTTMMVVSGEIGSLWPLAAALSTILSTPFVGAAFLGSRFRRATSAR